MKTTLTTIFLLISISMFGQEITKRREIQPMVNMIEQYKDGNLVSSDIHFSCADNRYFYLTEIVTLYYGSKEGFLTYLDEIKEFILTNESGTSGNIKTGNRISLTGNRVYIYDDKMEGFTSGPVKAMLRGLERMKQNVIDFK